MIDLVDKVEAGHSGLLNLTAFYISIVLTRTYAACHSECKKAFSPERSRRGRISHSQWDKNAALRPDVSRSLPR